MRKTLKLQASSPLPPKKKNQKPNKQQKKKNPKKQQPKNKQTKTKQKTKDTIQLIIKRLNVSPLLRFRPKIRQGMFRSLCRQVRLLLFALSLGLKKT